MNSINPATNKKVKEYKEFDKNQVHDLIEKAHQSFLSWKKSPFSERAKYFNKLASILEDEKLELAHLMTTEMGKPINEGVSEVEKCAWVCKYYAKNAELFLQSHEIDSDFSKSQVVYNPLGVILAIMPWNFPLWQVFRFAAPTLMAGNTAVLKHASNVPGCALAIENLFKKAGFPNSCFTTLLIGSKNMEQIIAHPQIKAVSLTGSTSAGRSVAELAGKNLKKSVLELGGSDPYLILDNKNLKETVRLCAKSRLLNTGQSCIAAKRFIVLEEFHQEFVSALKKEMESYKLGDPLDEKTQLGPMARHDLRDELHKIVSSSIEKGAKCILGGSIPDGEGAYYPATILDNIRPEMPAYR